MNWFRNEEANEVKLKELICWILLLPFLIVWYVINFLVFLYAVLLTKEELKKNE